MSTLLKNGIYNMGVTQRTYNLSNFKCNPIETYFKLILHLSSFQRPAANASRSHR